MRKVLILLFAMLLTALNLLAGERTVGGTVKDKANGQPLAFCNVRLLPTTTGTVTDAKGHFNLILPAEIYEPKLVISYLGYKADTIAITDAADYTIGLSLSAGAFNEVVVTGVSKATLIKENPVPVATVSTKAIERAMENNIIDVLVKSVPGLNSVKTGPNISKPFIRGLGYNRVLTLYDGVRQEGQQWGDEHGIEVDAYNIEKAEVIKGPSSLMYGSDALAGVVSLLPSMPGTKDGKLHGKFFSEYQSNNSLIGNGIRLTYADSHWSLAARGSYRAARNYTNAIDGRIYNTGFREANVSATARYTSKAGFSDLNFTMYDNLQGIPDGSRDSLTRQFTKQIAEMAHDNIKDRPLVTSNELNSYRLSPLHQHIRHYRVYSHHNYSFGKSDADILLAWQQNIRKEYNHPTMPQQAGMHVRLNTLNYGFRYNAPEVANIGITAGVNGMYQNNVNVNATDFPIPDYNLLDAGAYIYAKWKHKRWTISGGARYDMRYLQGNNFYTSIDSATGFGRHISGDAGDAYLQFPKFSKVFNGLSLSAGATYQVTENISLKANIARGYRAPNITEFASNGLDPGAHIVYLGNRNFKPEFSLQEDIGVTMDFKDVSASVSVFNNNIQNYIYLAQLVDANGDPVTIVPGNRTIQYQQASAHLFGGEATLDFHPSFIKGFSFNNSFSAVFGYNRMSQYKGTGVNGEYLPLIPPIKLLSVVSQDIKFKSEVVPVLNVKAEVEYSAAQNRYLALDFTETATRGFALLNLAATLHLNYTKKHTLQLQVQANNLLNTTYQSHLSRLKYFEYYAGGAGMYSMGRNLCAKLVLGF